MPGEFISMLFCFKYYVSLPLSILTGEPAFANYVLAIDSFLLVSPSPKMALIPPIPEPDVDGRTLNI